MLFPSPTGRERRHIGRSICLTLRVLLLLRNRKHPVASTPESDSGKAHRSLRAADRSPSTDADAARAFKDSIDSQLKKKKEEKGLDRCCRPRDGHEMGKQLDRADR